MTPRHPGRLGGSIFLKILAVFAGALVVISTYFFITHHLFDWERERLTVQATATNYAGYLVDDLGHPPDTAAARRLADRLGVGIRIEGPGVDWVSAQDIPAFADVDLPAYPLDGTVRAGITRNLGFGADMARGDYRYLLALQAGGGAGLGSGSGAEDIADALFMIVVLAGVYLLTRRLLRPVRILSDGVDRLRGGDWNVEMDTRRTDELGQLIVSFNDMARAVRERIRARDQLLLDVSHEIRSPLTRMKVALEMMPDSNGKRSVIEDIEETEAMINELLETERLDSRHGGLDRSRVDVNALVRESVAAHTDEAPGIEVEGPDRPLYADIDRERIRAVFENILSNALKYSQPGGAPVRVVVDANPEEVLVSVHDSGVGIAPGDLTHVFEPFYRVDRSRSRDTGGYGLGLSLAKRIAEAHGGSIEVSSTLGEGTSLLVSLPALSADPGGSNGPPSGRKSPRWRL